MVTRKYAITPKRAQELLDTNLLPEAERTETKLYRNRTISEKSVNSYATTMQRGDWMLNGETIKLTKSGRLADGHHRLLAVIKHGSAVEFEVREDLEEEAISTLDTGRKRLAGDVLGMRGVENAKGNAAAAKIVLNFTSGYNLSYTQTPQAVEQFVDEFPSIREVYEVCRPASMVIPVSPLTALMFLGGVDGQFTDRVQPFLDKLISGAGMELNDPRLALREALANSRRRNGATGRTLNAAYALHVATRAWNAFVEDRTLTIAKFHPSKGGGYSLVPIKGSPKFGCGIAELRRIVAETKQQRRRAR